VSGFVIIARKIAVRPFIAENRMYYEETRSFAVIRFLINKAELQLSSDGTSGGGATRDQVAHFLQGQGACGHGTGVCYNLVGDLIGTVSGRVSLETYRTGRGKHACAGAARRNGTGDRLFKCEKKIFKKIEMVKNKR